MRRKLIFLGLICLSIFAFVGCGTEKLDISNCIDIRYGEFNGSAKIYENSINLEKLTQIPKLQSLTSDMLKGDYKITLVGDKTDLKNGDKVKLDLQYNKELYKRDFGVEFTFEPKEITIEGLPDELTDINQISKEQWEELYKIASKQAEEEAKNNNYKDLKLEKLLYFKEKDTSDGVSIEFIYSYKNKNNEIRYFSFYNTLHFEKENNLKSSKFSLSPAWENNFLINYSKSLDDILNDMFKPGSYEVIWSADKQ